MNFNNYTQKSLEAVQLAQSLARQNHNQQLEQIHLLCAMLSQEGGLVPQLLRKLDMSVESLSAAANAEMNKLPRVSGSREADRFYVSADLDAAFASAEGLGANPDNLHFSAASLIEFGHRYYTAFRAIEDCSRVFDEKSKMDDAIRTNIEQL